MATKLKQMLGKEFVKKILEGERDFSRIELEAGFNLKDYERFDEMQNYLKRENLKSNPVLINNSKFQGIGAQGLYLPHVQGENADFRYTYLGNSNLENAKLWNASFKWAYLCGANLKDANLENADLTYTNIANTNFEGANLFRVNLNDVNIGKAKFKNTNLKEVKNLEKSSRLEYAIFEGTKVTSKEKAIIEQALTKRFFVVED